MPFFQIMTQTYENFFRQSLRLNKNPGGQEFFSYSIMLEKTKKRQQQIEKKAKKSAKKAKKQQFLATLTFRPTNFLQDLEIKKFFFLTTL